MFLHIWLRREEAKIKLAILVAQGLIESSSVEKGSEVGNKYKEYLESALPYLVIDKSKNDDVMIQAMRKEVSKGPVEFKPIQVSNPFNNAIKRMTMSDDFRKKLEDKARKRVLR